MLQRFGVVANGREPRDPPRQLEQLEQQWQELPVGEPQQQLAGQPEQQPRVPSRSGPSSTAALDEVTADPAAILS